MQQRESLNKAILAMHPCRHYMVQVEVQVVTLSDQISTRSKFRGGLWQTLRAHGNKPWMSSSHYAYVQFTESKRQSISRRACAGSLILASAVSLRRARAGPTRRSVRPVATGFGYQPRPPFVMIIVIGLARPWARTFERPLAGATRRLSCGIIYCSVVACYIEISPKNFEISCSCDWTRPVFAAVRGPITTGGKGKTKSQTSGNVRGYRIVTQAAQPYCTLFTFGPALSQSPGSRPTEQNATCIGNRNQQLLDSILISNILHVSVNPATLLRSLR